jgi:hypothetical protein
MKMIAPITSAMFFILLGCSSSPSNSSVEAYLESYWSGCNKLVSISDVNKTNGVPGDREYKVDFSYNLVFKHPISNVFHLRNYCTKQKPADTLAHVLLRSGAVKEGDSLQMTGTVLLVKSEKGWISNDQ